jgi:hypothetical protein
MAGLFSGDGGDLFILTIDGKFYRGNVHNGQIQLITQTALPLLGNNLRGDMASCVPRKDRDRDDNDGDDDGDDRGKQDANNSEGGMHITPNPAQTGQITLSVNATENGTARLQIISPTGVPLQNRNLSLINGVNQVQLDVSQLHQGVYSVILFLASGRVSTAKFIRL